jgi:signal transduction histidine kinase
MQDIPLEEAAMTGGVSTDGTDAVATRAAPPADNYRWILAFLASAGIASAILGLIPLLRAATTAGDARFSDAVVLQLVAAALGAATCAIHIRRERLRCRAAERENEQQRRALERAVAHAGRLALAGELAAGVAHEINNPMSTIIARLEMAARSSIVQCDRKLQEHISLARDGADRVRVLARDLAGLARADDDSRAAVDVRQVVESALAMASFEIRDAEVVLELAESPPIQAHARRLGQVFLNLLINAAHALRREPTVRDEIRIVSRVVSENLVVEISDSGTGIAADVLPRIFDPFFTTKPEGKGTGLGLSVSLRIVRSLGGDIAVTSQVGRGSTFRVRLPLANLSVNAGTRIGESHGSERTVHTL